MIGVVTEGCLLVPSSLERMETTWREYELAQERIQLCRDVVGWNYCFGLFVCFSRELFNSCCQGILVLSVAGLE